MIQRGTSQQLGAHWDGDGVNFAVYSGAAERIELCLFDERDQETHRYTLPDVENAIWHGYLPGCGPGQRYGYRTHGLFSPAQGQWFNPNKLLLDPYARQLTDGFRWSDELYAFDADGDDKLQMSLGDSAPFMPKGVVQGSANTQPTRLSVPWADTLIYEINVRGFTQLHPLVPKSAAGNFRGLAHPEILKYLRALGVTSVELMPVHAFVDEQFLDQRGMRNYWGYNTLGFFAPASRYLAGGSPDTFRTMVNALHDEGMEVILDVVFNHTAEGDHRGPSLSFRGLDNGSYYRLQPDNLMHYVNDTGCGNTINMDHPQTRALVLDSLRYWAGEMGVDGFRFDLAPVLGRGAHGFDANHPFFAEVQRDPLLRDTKLIAEPWDIGPGGYQLGNFPANWAEWNDQFRDTIRRYWLTDTSVTTDFARRIHGSSDLFERSARPPTASINMAASHDGYTLLDTVSYVERHNSPNGEDNRDGHHNNYSNNHGVEGPTDDSGLLALRRRQRLNLLASVLFSQGTPMLLGGDEFGNSQAGNNNAYCQDNETGWLDWTGVTDEPDFLQQVRNLIAIRKSEPLLKQSQYLHGQLRDQRGLSHIQWLNPEGGKMQDLHWHEGQCLVMLLRETRRSTRSRLGSVALAICCNASNRAREFQLPIRKPDSTWQCLFESFGGKALLVNEARVIIESSSIALFRRTPPTPAAD